jgi:acetyl-CoA acetyltransferase
MKDVVILGVGMTRFGKFMDRSLKNLTREVFQTVLEDAGISKEQIQAAYVGNESAGLITGQYGILGQVVLRPLGLGDISVVNTSNACASGCSALHLGYLDIASGFHDCVLTLGLEKLYTDDREKFLQAANASKDMDALREPPQEKKKYGDAIGRFAERGRQYIESGWITKQHLAKVSSKNHINGSLNPYAQYQKSMSVEEVLASPLIVEPLHRVMCAPVGDGAAAAILCSPQFARRHTNRPIFVASSVMRTGADLGPDKPGLGQRIGQEAYERAGVVPSDIDVFEVSDATAMTEILSYEELGLCTREELAAFIDSGAPELTGRQPVNPSGGLESRGHPFGATGIAQVAELVWQLRGQAGKRQVQNRPKLALAQVYGGRIEPEAAAIGTEIIKC